MDTVELTRNVKSEGREFLAERRAPLGAVAETLMRIITPQDAAEETAFMALGIFAASSLVIGLTGYLGAAWVASI